MFVGALITSIRTFPSPPECLFGNGIKEVLANDLCSDEVTLVCVQVRFFQRSHILNLMRELALVSFLAQPLFEVRANDIFWILSWWYFYICHCFEQRSQQSLVCIGFLLRSLLLELLVQLILFATLDRAIYLVSHTSHVSLSSSTLLVFKSESFIVYNLFPLFLFGLLAGLLALLFFGWHFYQSKLMVGLTFSRNF